MTNITFPLSEANVAQCMAERDAEIERLRAALTEIIEIEAIDTAHSLARRALEPPDAP